MKQEGYGAGYKYWHDDPSGAARMPCLPPSLEERVYYRGPGARKRERPQAPDEGE
jgi:replication-associated recombination protein RarA